MNDNYAPSNFFVSFIKKHWLTLSFLLGFVTDFLLLNRVDDRLDNLVLLFHVTLATSSILLFYVGVAERGGEWWSAKLRHLMPVFMQYSFGGILSGMLIFYGRSGDFFASAPFFVLIISVIAVNELVKKQSNRLIYNLAVYFVGLFSYCVLVVPVVIGDMGDIIFIGSGILALLILILVVKILSVIIPNFIALQKRTLVFVVGVLYVLFNGFYFFNIIPPIPLSLTELSIYQSVEKIGSNYHIIKEETSWFKRLSLAPITFHPQAGQGASCFARVYAPTKITANITQRWEYLDSDGNWNEHYKQAYRITGENKNGYRGYTKITSIHNGKWRCSVENARGQVLGRKTFIVDDTRPPEELVTIVE